MQLEWALANGLAHMMALKYVHILYHLWPRTNFGVCLFLTENFILAAVLNSKLNQSRFHCKLLIQHQRQIGLYLFLDKVLASDLDLSHLSYSRFYNLCQSSSRSPESIRPEQASAILQPRPFIELIDPWFFVCTVESSVLCAHAYERQPARGSSLVFVFLCPAIFHYCERDSGKTTLCNS